MMFSTWLFLHSHGLFVAMLLLERLSITTHWTCWSAPRRPTANFARGSPPSRNQDLSAPKLASSLIKLLVEIQRTSNPRHFSHRCSLLSGSKLPQGPGARSSKLGSHKSLDNSRMKELSLNYGFCSPPLIYSLSTLSAGAFGELKLSTHVAHLPHAFVGFTGIPSTVISTHGQCARVYLFFTRNPLVSQHYTLPS
jgi:hypothetical protein